MKAVVALCLTLFATSVAAQELEPRAYSNAPVGFQFVVLAYSYATGGLVFDPNVPIEDASANVNIGALGYVRTLGFLGKTSKITIVVPVAEGRATGLVAGEPAERILSGLGDARLGFGWLFHGAPARTGAEFMKADRSPTVAGLTFALGIPTGKYDEDRLLNIGTNRFSLKSEIGISHSMNRWTLEAAAGASVYQDNGEWLVTSTRTQDPVYSMQTHVVRDFRTRLWLALDATYFWGGQAKVDGAPSGVELGNSRIGMTLSVPVGKTQAIKLTAASGVSTRTGTDFDQYGVAWQWAILPNE